MAKPVDFGSTSLKMTPRRVVAVLTGIVAALVAMNIVAYIVGGTLTISTAELVLRRFSLDGEQTIPSWFSSSLLLIAAGLLALIGFGEVKKDGEQRRSFFAHWLFLSGIFVLLSLDEAASFHELLILPLRERLELGGVLYFAWVLPAIVVCLVLAAVYLPFLLRLPVVLRRGLIAAASTYLAGALGMEMIGGVVAERVGQETLSYFLVTTLEETLELLGLVVLTHVLLRQAVTVTLRTSNALELKRPPLDSRPPSVPQASAGVSRATAPAQG